MCVARETQGSRRGRSKGSSQSGVMQGQGVQDSPLQRLQRLNLLHRLSREVPADVELRLRLEAASPSEAGEESGPAMKLIFLTPIALLAVAAIFFLGIIANLGREADSLISGNRW